MLSIRRKLLFGLLLLFGATVSGPAFAKPSVNVNILVVEATTKGSIKDKRLAKIVTKIQRTGFKGARVLDDLNANNIEEGSRVSLQMPSKKQNLAVQVLKVNKKKVKLKISLDKTSFSTSAEHTDGAMLLLVMSKKGDKALMLAVTPRIGK